MRGIIQFSIAVFVVFVAWQASKPWQNRYFLTKSLEGIAQYATKNSEESTQKELQRVLIDKGFTDLVEADQISIEKDDDTGAVTVRVEYQDTVSVFGIDLKPLTFTIEVRAARVRSSF